MHWSPNFSAASLTKARRFTAAVLIDTLSAPQFKQLADVLHGAHAAADGERHEAGFRGARHHVEDGVAVLVARRDVEEGQLVGARRVIGDRGLDRIAGIAQVDEVDALDDAAVLHVEAGNDADLERHQAARAARISLSASAGSSRPS